MELKTTNEDFTVTITSKDGEATFEVITCECLAEELKTTRATINGYTSTLDGKTGESKLDFCYPHKSSTNNGPKYVIKNKKYQPFVESYLRRKHRKESKSKV